MSDKYQQIAQILCNITNQLIQQDWTYFKNIQVNNTRLKSRIGSGKATYCKHDIKAKTFTITYGKKMIKSKFSPDEVVHWLSYREIIRRNYFTGDTSLPCLLAHTVCHEFAHLIQQLSGWHKRGSIHNSGYYQILDQLHKSGLAETIKNDIVRECEAQNLELIANIQPAIVTKKTQIEVFFSVNDTVCFDYKNKTHSGTVIKVNRKTLIIRVKNLFRHSRWKVPKLLVRNSS